MSILDEIGNALADEFAVPDAGDMTVMITRVLMAGILGGIIGWEREQKGRAAGLKTHILVSIGSALFVLAPLMHDVPADDVTRVMQGIVSGIGFLGAGAILKLDKGERIEGLTTAAGIWMTAAIGMAAGMGQEWVAVITTIVAVIVVGLLPKLSGQDRGAPHSSISGHDQ